MDERERFLGWLVIQPKHHRVHWSEITSEELKTFGVATQRVEKALIASYEQLTGHKVEIVYLLRLGESALRGAWHLHFHMIPRTSSMKERKCIGMEVMKWRKISREPAPEKEKIAELMDLIRHSVN